jgi:tetratricopeptide (TPR) repeat protein
LGAPGCESIPTGDSIKLVKQKGTSMASKVNTKFVVGLVIGTALVLGGVYMASVYLVKNTPQRLVAAGDAQLKLAKTHRDAGDLKKAEEAVNKAIAFFSKAVNKEQTNVELLRKWDEALRQYAPADRVLYERAFKNDYLMIRRQTAILLKTDVAAHREYLQTWFKQTVNATVNPQRMLETTEEMLQYFDQASDPKEREKKDGLLRYRGMARVQLVMKASDAPASDFEAARADLEAALRYDPKDELAAESLYTLNLLEAERSEARALESEAAAAKARADECASRFLAANPRNALISLAMARTQLRMRVLEFRKIVTREGQEEAQPRIRAALLPALDEAAAACDAADALTMEPLLLPMLAQLESTIDPEGKLRRSVALSTRLSEARPEDPEVSLYVAEFAAKARDFERAISVAQRVTSAAVKPISLAGIQLFEFKRVASGQVASWAMDIVESSTSEDDRAKALERAKTMRDAYAGYVEAADSVLKFVDGRVALAERRWGDASRLIKEYNDAMRDSDPRGLLYAAIAALSRSSPDTGYAKERLTRLLSIEPTNVAAMMQLANAELMNQDYPAAERILKQVLVEVPGNEVAQRLLDQITGNAQNDDPIVKEIKDALAKSTPGNEHLVVEHLRDAVARLPGEPQLVEALARQLMSAGDREGALAAVEAGLALKPEAKTLAAFKTILSTGDEFQRDKLLIDQSDLPELYKLIRLHSLYRAHGKKTEALAELEKAEAKYPESPEVVETRFLWAIENAQWDSANKMMDVATAKNMDQANGLTFRSRLQAARGQVADAVTSAEGALARVPANAEMFRLLAKLLAKQGRLEESLAMFKKGVEARPTDPSANRDYVEAMLNLGRSQEALAHCRKNPRVANSDADLMGMWLNLEAALGDRAMALSARERLYKLDPGNRRNALSLAEMLVADGRHEDGAKVITALKTKKDDLEIANLEARSFDAQQKYTEARGAYERIVASSDSQASMSASIVLSNYLASRGELDESVRVMEAARARQDPKILEIDRAMTQMFEKIGKPDRSIECARRVIAATGDEQGAFRKHIVRTYLRMGKFDEADKEYATLTSLESKDPEVLLLKADTKLARRDIETAQFILDDAVARFAGETSVYNVRGTFHVSTTRKFREAADDFTKSLTINPLQPGILMSRARCFVFLRLPDEALADLARLARLAYSDAGARRHWIDNLLDLGRIEDAVAGAKELVALNGGNENVASEMGTLFGAAYGKWEEATQFFEMAYEKSKSANAAAELVVCYLKREPKKLTEAGAVIQATRDLAATNWPLVLSGARWQAAQSDMVSAREAMTRGLALMGTERIESVQFWFQVASEIMPDKAELAAYLEQLERSGTAPEFVRWYRGVVLSGQEATQAQGFEILASFADPAKPESIRRANFKMFTGMLFRAQRVDEALAFSRTGLEQFPEEAELLNNVAYILAKELGKADEALPLAERAVKAAGGSADAYDTLGYVQYMRKAYPEAKAALERAYGLAAGANNFRALIITVIHLGQVHAAMGDKEAALSRFQEAQNYARQVPTLAKEFASELAELQKMVE